MAKKMILGVLGMSEGNGHPYSWSAIFNGYNENAMASCPFPAIPEYLSKQKFPEDGLGEWSHVGYIWTQDKGVSEKIAKASNIEKIVDAPEEMIGKIDALLLARDDAENHYKMALPFLKAGIPIFIDKPLALSIEEAENIYNQQQYEDQVFTCSAMRYAAELQLTEAEKEEIGSVKHVEGAVPKKWETYGIHIVDPILKAFPDRGKLKKIKPLKSNGISHCLIEWENISAYIKVTGKVSTPYHLTYFGENGSIEKRFVDAYACFKASLKSFVEVVNKREKNIPKAETLEAITIIEAGRS